MPLPLEKSYAAPNAIYAPQILLQSAIVNGQLMTSAHITLQTARVSEKGVWEIAPGRSETVVINDILNLPDDLSSQAKRVQDIYGAIVELIGQVNSTRKVL